MTGEDAIRDLVEQFRSQSQVVLTDPSGRRFFIVNVSTSVGKPALLMAYEGRGSMVYDFDRPLNEFRLITSGFPKLIAEQAAKLVNTLFPINNPQTQAKALLIAEKGTQR